MTFVLLSIIPNLLLSGYRWYCTQADPPLHSCRLCRVGQQAFVPYRGFHPRPLSPSGVPPSSFGCQRLISLSHGESKMPEREGGRRRHREDILGAASIKFTPNKGYDISPTLATLMRAKARVKFCQRRSGSYSGFGKLS